MPRNTYAGLAEGRERAAANPRDAQAGEFRGAGDAEARARGDKWRAAGYTDSQVRHELLREGFTAKQASDYLAGELTPKKTAPGTGATAGAEGAEKAGDTPKPTSGEEDRSTQPGTGSGGSSRGGGVTIGGSAAGVLLAIVAYPAGIAFLTGGPAGLRKWFLAKFLNQTSTSHGVFDTQRADLGGEVAGGVGSGAIPSAYTTGRGGRTIVGAGYVNTSNVVTKHTKATGGRPSGGKGGWGAPGSNLVTVTLAGHRVRVNRRTAPAFQGLVRDLVAAGYHPRVIGGYANRNIAGTGTKSNHAWGAAIDIDPARNPRYGSARGGRHAIPDGLAIKLAAAHGLRWGGTYRNSKDYMHFEDLNGPAS